MKKTNLLTLSATVLMALTVVGCNANDNQTSGAVTANDVLSQAATSLWTMYKDQNNSYALGSFDLVKKVTIEGGAYTVNISWAIENLQGSTAEAVHLQETTEEDNFQTVYVGYYDFAVQGETTFDLVPTLTYDGVSKKMGEILEKDSKGNDKVFSRKTKELVFNTYAEYKQIADKAGGKKDDKCVAAVKGYVTGISKNGQYVYIQDQEHGYLVYGSGYDKQTDFAVGDFVAVAGAVYVYSGGCYEFVSATVKKLDSATAGYAAPTGYTDATTAFDGAKDSKDTSLVPYQNMMVEIKDCKVGSVDGSHYYFTTNSGKKYNLYWSTSYFLTKDQNNEWANLFSALVGEKDFKINVKGLVNCYSSSHQIYPSEVNCFDVVSTKTTVADQNNEYARIAKKVITNTGLNGFKPFFNKAGEVTLPSKGVLGATIEWSLPADAPTQFKIENGKLKVTPTKEGDIASTVLTGTVKVGDSTQKITYTVNAKDVEDQEQANLAAAEISEIIETYGAATLKTTSDVFGDAKITWALKEAVEGVKIENNVVSFAKDSTLSSCVLVATVKVGEKTATKEVTVTNNPVTSIATVIENESQDVRIRGVVVGAGAAKDTDSNFVVFDGTNYIYVRDQAKVTVGDEIIIHCKYEASYGLHAVKFVDKNIVVVSSKNALPTTTTGSVTATALEAAGATIEDTTAAEAKNAENLATYQGKLIEITDGYIIKNGNYYGLASDATATSYSINLYYSESLESFVGKKVKLIAVNRGSNTNKGNISFQVVSVKLDA